MTFRRNALPPDDYPDAFESRAYSRYHPGMRPGPWHWVRYTLPRSALAVLVTVLAVAGGLLVFLLLPPLEPEIVIITSIPGAETLPPIGGDFPADLTQQYTRVPAKIDHDLAAGESHAYRFYLEAGTTWRVTVFPSDGFSVNFTFYDASGTILDRTDPGSPSTAATLIYQAPVSGQYGMVISGSGEVFGSGYTLSLMPVQ